MQFLRLGLAAVPLLGLIAPAWAGNLVVNGDFSQSTVAYTGTGTNFYSPGNSFELGTYGLNGEDGAYSGALTGWTSYGENSAPYALWYNNATATSVTALSQYDNVTSGNTLGGNEVFRAVPTLNAPSGFVALDGGLGSGNGGVTTGLAQAISVTTGTVYELTFNWAAAQLVTGNGNFNVNLYFGLGTNPTLNTSSASFVTPCANGTNCLAQGATSPWLTETAYFEATTTGTEYLSFFSVGGAGNPPMALLDDVSLVDAPEPGSVAIVLAGVAGLAFVQRRRAQRT